MDPGTTGQPTSNGWSDQVARQEPQSPLAITFTRPPAVLRLAGVIDESTYLVLRRALAKAAMTGDHEICVDLAEIEFCDLAGLRIILALAGPGRPVSRLVIAHLPGQLADIMHILGWDATPGVVVLKPVAGPS